MPRISGGSPWLAAAGGLGEGLTGGLLTGMELAERRRRVEAERNRDTMALLMQGVKGMPEDPEQAAAYWQNFGQVFQGVTGQPLPPWNLGQVKPWADRLKDSVAQIKAATNLPDDQAFTYAFHLLTGGKGAPKLPEERVPWTSPTGQTYMLKPGEAARGDIGALYGGQRVDIAGAGLGLRERALEQQQQQFEQKQESETTKETPMTETEQGKFSEMWQARMDAAKTPEEEAKVKAEIFKRGGEVYEVQEPTWWGAGTPRTVKKIMPPTTKRTVTTKGGAAQTPPPGMIRVRNKRTGQDEFVTQEQYRQIQAAQGKR